MVYYNGFRKIILFGPYLHQHENAWFFYGMQKAFIYKHWNPKNVIWVNHETKEKLDTIDLSNSLIITDGIHDIGVPLREDCFYFLYENYKSKYDPYQKLHIGKYSNKLPDYVKQWKDKFYIQYSLEHRELFFPLATELVPQEILINQQKIVSQKNNKVCLLGNVSGSVVSNILADIKYYCLTHYLKFSIVNNMSWDKRNSDLNKCQVVPVISSDEQIENDEIDYRLFQTISYGAFPVVNSEISANLFPENYIYYNSNGRDLIECGIMCKNNNYDISTKWNAMEIVKNNHTFIKRLETIFWVLDRL